MSVNTNVTSDGGGMSSIPAEPAEPEEFRSDALPAGAHLLRDQYTIEKFLNSGGFGITYLARDSLDRQVVIKECFPNGICARAGLKVRARVKTLVEDFDKIKERFVQEARSLATLQHPNIVGVHQVFEDNNTAYMALDFVQGKDLLELSEDENAALAPETIRDITVKLLKAIEFMHSKGLLHRDISPDNILVRDNSDPVLIDFGSAKPSSAKKNGRTVTEFRVVKDGYSPQEFYLPDAEQTPASDLYAFGATMYHAITGEVPAESQKRLAAFAGGEPDPLELLGPTLEGYDEAFLDAINTALNVRARDRLQSAGEWLDTIGEASAEEAKLIPLGGDTLPAVGKDDPVLFGAEEGKQNKRDDRETVDLVRSILDEPDDSVEARPRRGGASNLPVLNPDGKVVPARIRGKSVPRSVALGGPPLDSAALRPKRPNRSVMPYVASLAGAMLVGGLSYGAWQLSQGGPDTTRTTDDTSALFPVLGQAPLIDEDGGLPHRVDGLIADLEVPAGMADPLTETDASMAAPNGPSEPSTAIPAGVLSNEITAEETAPPMPGVRSFALASPPAVMTSDAQASALPTTLPTQPSAVAALSTSATPPSPQEGAETAAIEAASDTTPSVAPLAVLSVATTDPAMGTPQPLESPLLVALEDSPAELAQEPVDANATSPRILSLRNSASPTVPEQSTQLAAGLISNDATLGISGKHRLQPVRPEATSSSFIPTVADVLEDAPTQRRISVAPRIGALGALSTPITREAKPALLESTAALPVPLKPDLAPVPSDEPQTLVLTNPADTPQEAETTETASLDLAAPQPVTPLIEPAPETSTATPRVITLPQPTEPAAPATTQAAAVPAGSDLSVSWNVGLPFTRSANQPTRIATVFPGAPSWMIAGQELVSVNGVQIDNIASIPSILKLITAVEGQTEVDALIEYRAEGSETLLEGRAKLPVSMDMDFNGHRFQTRFEGAWRTFVVNSPTSSEDALREGDEIVAYLQTNEPFETPEAFRDLLEREVAAGRPILSFAIRRAGDLWVAGLTTGE